MKKLALILVIFCSFIGLKAQDSTFIYQENGIIRVDNLENVPLFLNPMDVTYRIRIQDIVLKDGVSNKEYNIGSYNEIFTEDTIGFASLESAINYINGVITPFSQYTASKTSDFDPNNRVGANTVFGDRITGIRKTDIAAQFQYGVEDGTSETILENGGTVVIENSLLKIRTGTNTAGRASIQSTETVRYVPGQELYCFFTSVFDTAKVNSYQRVGLFDDANGFFVGYEDTVFTFTRRRDTVDYHQTIDLVEFNEKNNYEFIPTLGNIYKISYGYLGFAPITLEVMKPDGSWTVLSKIEYPNTQAVTHTLQTFLPIRGEAANTGNNTNLEIRSGSLAAGIVDGGNEDIAGRQFTWSTDETITFSDSVTIVTFRNKTTFNSIENRVPARLLFVSFANSANKLIKWRILKNPTLEASPVPVWNDVNTNNSTLEYSLNAVANYSLSDDLFLAWVAGAIDQDFLDVEKYILDLPPGGTASFVIYSGATNADADISIRWSERF